MVQIISNDGDFESSESDSDIDEPPNRRRRTADRIPAVDTNAEFVRGQNLTPTDIPFAGDPGVKVRNIAGLSPFGYLKYHEHHRD